MNSLRKTLLSSLFLLFFVAPIFAADGKPLAGVKDLFDKGGFVMMIIVGLSVIGVALACERLVSLRQAKLVPRNLKTAVATARNVGSTDQLKSLVDQGKTPLARILKVGLARASGGIPEMERAMESQGALESDRLMRPIRPIGILAQVEPLLGLLGTILGMITTFNLLHTTSAAERVTTLAPGIGQALYTTAAGLAIAIPFVLMHHHLQGRVMRATEEWSVLGTDLVDLVFQPSVAARTKPEATPAVAASAEEAEQA